MKYYVELLASFVHVQGNRKIELCTKISATDVGVGVLVEINPIFSGRRGRRPLLGSVYFDDKGDKRKLLGAVAGGMVAENVLKYAQENGLFVLVQSGDSVTVADATHDFKPREW